MDGPKASKNINVKFQGQERKCKVYSNPRLRSYPNLFGEAT